MFCGPGVEVNTADMIKTLEESGDYRVLRRLKPRDVFETVAPGQELRIGVLIDLETTGLDTTSDEVIELGLVKFAYLADDRVAHVVDTLGAFNEPTKPIPPEVTELTGITAEMVAGIASIRMLSSNLFRTPKSLSLITRRLIVQLQNGIGLNSKTWRGPAQPIKSNGARKVLKDHV
jgi:hypothetical protein